MTSETWPAARPVNTISRVYFGREDGSRGVRTVEIVNGRSCTSTAYWDIKVNLYVSADDCVLMKSTEPLTRLPSSIPIQAVQSCRHMIAMQFVGTDVIQGLRVERFKENGPSARADTYMAPDLGCLMVRSEYFWKDSSGRITGTTIDEPVEVKLEEPDPRLFHTPSTHREVPPSERRNALDMFFRNDTTPTVWLRRGNELADAKYWAAQNR
jgi:hypothetical protein